MCAPNTATKYQRRKIGEGWGHVKLDDNSAHFFKGIMNNNVVYPPCRKCGASHGMGVEEMATGKIEPIDLCHKCLWAGLVYKPTVIDMKPSEALKGYYRKPCVQINMSESFKKELREKEKEDVLIRDLIHSCASHVDASIQEEGANT